MKQKTNALASPFRSVHGKESDKGSNPLESLSEEEPQRRSRMGRRASSNSNGLRVEIPKFKGKFNPNEFLEWLYTIECVFDYKQVAEDKTVKLIALKLRKYASLWWTNLCAKRVRNQKEKIRTWEKIKTKLRSWFLPPSYL